MYHLRILLLCVVETLSVSENPPPQCCRDPQCMYLRILLLCVTGPISALEAVVFLGVGTMGLSYKAVYHGFPYAINVI